MLQNDNCENKTSVSIADDSSKSFHTNRITIVETTKNTLNIAKRRWKILAKALCHRVNTQSIDSTTSTESDENEDAIVDDRLSSVRRFTSFDLFRQMRCDENESDDNWFILKLTNKIDCYSVKIHYVNQLFTPDDLMGFNNTGNICIWPSEEALAYCVLADLELFRGKRIIELGGGMTCLAGFFIAKYAFADSVHLTDGNEISMANVQKMIENEEFWSCKRLHCSALQWKHVNGTTTEKFDFVLSADCLFFDNARTDLVNAIWNCLAEDGCGMVMAPRRGNTLNQFIGKAVEKGFLCNVIECYDMMIWEKHLQLMQTDFYDEDLHYPILIRLTKKMLNS